MTSQMDIRQARPGDETAVRDCAAQAYQQYVAALGKEPAPMRADFAAQIGSGAVFVAVGHDANAMGFIVFYRKGNHIFLENVAVHPEYAGHSIGKRLIAFCESEAKRTAAKSVRLYTNAKMTKNQSLYHHLGYVETGRRHEDGFDRVYFEKLM